MKTTYTTGILGERKAEEWLRRKQHMRTLERRYRNKAGEIDLIMLDRDTIVFVEVKTRTNAVPGTGMMSVDRKKQQRIARCAVIYLMENNWLNCSVRFDIAEVSGDNVIHVSNAFQPGAMFYR